MKPLKYIQIIFVYIIASLGVTASAEEEAPLELDVYQSDENSFYASSVLVTGKTEAILVDAQFTLPDAHQVVAKIQHTGKQLKAVYISHGDPDYYFGLQVIKEAFPDVKVYSTKKTLEHIKNTVQDKLDYWGPILGSNGPTKIVLPEVINGDSLSLDGEKLKIIGLKNHPERTFLSIPSISAVIGGVPVYGNVHLFIADAATKAQRDIWRNILDEITALNPKIVIPGHATKDAPKNLKSVDFSREYLNTYEKAVAKAHNSTDLIDMINKKYPGVALPVALEIGAKVVMGEMEW